MGRSSAAAPGVTGAGESASELLEVAREAARIGAASLLERVGATSVLREKSSPTDPVTEADEASESAIRSFLAARRPNDALLAEEGGMAEGSSGLRWVVDPLDGTVNFLYGQPHWCVSVAVEDGEGPIAGVVLDPLRGEEFSALRGGQPMLDGIPFERRQVHSAQSDDPLRGIMLATGFHYESEVRRAQAAPFAGLLPRVRDVRRGGSAALDLCWTAIGRFDAYGEHGVMEWDVAAGALICLSAGLEVGVLPAVSGRPAGLVAGEPEVVAALAAEWDAAASLRQWPSLRLG